MVKNSIEKDVKMVEDFIDGVSVFLQKYSTKKVEKIIDEESYIAIKHILSDYKKLQEEFKAVDSECSRLERKEVELEKIIDLMAKTINEAYYASGDFEEWFENNICKVQRYEDYTYLEKDIQQYFKNKAKEVK